MFSIFQDGHYNNSVSVDAKNHGTKTAQSLVNMLLSILLGKRLPEQQYGLLDYPLFQLIRSSVTPIFYF